MARGGILGGAPGGSPTPASAADTAMGVAERAGVGRLLRRLPTWRGVLVFTYHRIGDGRRSALDRDLWSATAGELDEQLRLLTASFDLIGPPDLPGVIESGRGRHVMLTFDDGYRDNWELALPLLRAHGTRATFFLATGFLDRPRLPWWDEVAWMVRASPHRCLQAPALLEGTLEFDDSDDRHEAIRVLLGRYKALPGDRTEQFLDDLGEACATGRAGPEQAASMWMTWQMARELRDSGMWIGGHTVNHPVLARLDAESQAQEISGCAQRLEQELELPMRYFSYPVGVEGTFDQRTRDCLERGGVQLAFSYRGGYQRLSRSGRFDRYDIPRATVAWFMTPSRVRASATLPQLFARW